MMEQRPPWPAAVAVQGLSCSVPTTLPCPPRFPRPTRPLPSPATRVPAPVLAEVELLAVLVLRREGREVPRVHLVAAQLDGLDVLDLGPGQFARAGRGRGGTTTAGRVGTRVAYTGVFPGVHGCMQGWCTRTQAVPVVRALRCPHPTPWPLGPGQRALVAPPPKPLSALPLSPPRVLFLQLPAPRSPPAPTLVNSSCSLSALGSKSACSLSLSCSSAATFFFWPFLQEGGSRGGGGGGGGEKMSQSLRPLSTVWTTLCAAHVGEVGGAGERAGPGAPLTHRQPRTAMPHTCPAPTSPPQQALPRPEAEAARWEAFPHSRLVTRV